MRQYTRWIALILALACCVSLAACTQPEHPTEPDATAGTTGPAEQQTQYPEGIVPVGAYIPVDDAPALLNQAKWIWADTNDNNVWVDFRKTFTLQTIPETAIAEIAVENKYYLWVNGQEVVYDGGLKRGPNPTDGYFDRIDLAPYLRQGENVIAVKAWFWGLKGEDAQSYSNVPVDTAGLLFALDTGEGVIVSDSGWRAFQDQAFKDDSLPEYGVPQPNYRFPEYNIYYRAADRQDEGWTDPAYDDSHWMHAQERGSCGDAPWNALHLRPIPLLKQCGLQDYLNTGDYVDYTTTVEESITMRLPYNAQITPYLEVSAAEEAVITMITDNTVSAQSVYTTYVTSGEGRQSFESPAWISGQYITYIVPAGVTIHRLAYRESGYDTEIVGSFSMGNAFFDTLWQMGARTQYLCIRENFMDCPDRERAQWTGDATSQMRQMMYCLDTRTYALYQKMLSQKAAWVVTGEGRGKLNDLLPTVMPIYTGYYELPAQELAGIVGIWDYYLYTGDATVLHIMYEPALHYLQKWKTDTNGLVKHKTGQGLVDWQDTGANKVDTKVSENAWYYWALATVRKMALALEKDTGWLDETMAALYEGYQTLWVDGLGYATTETPDDRGNALAVLSGLAPEERYEPILQVLKTSRMASSYMEVYVLQAMCEMGYVSEALDRMEERYGTMVQTNLEEGYTTLWEYYQPGQGTKNHAWTASPVYLLSKYVGGIRPTAPGYGRYEIIPDFSHSDHIQTKVETILGGICIDATMGENGKSVRMTLTLPQGGLATVAVPLVGSGVVTVNGTVVYDNGPQPVDGITFVSQEDGYCRLELAISGNVILEVN